MTQESPATHAQVRRSVTVALDTAAAFELFTAGFARWWPLESHHVLEGEAETALIEPRPGGRWYERAPDGRECDWGCVRAWEPPNRILFAWQLTPEWKFDPDPARATEVEVLFQAEGAGTRVTVEHRGFEVHGEPGVAMRGSVGGDGGWSGLLAAYSAAAA